MAERLYSLKMGVLKMAGVTCCERCGFEHPAALHFHHRDPATKRFGVNTANLSRKTFSMEEIIEEVAKCEVICANCHAIEHCTWDAHTSMLQ
jgi:hypothetical protein